MLKRRDKASNVIIALAASQAKAVTQLEEIIQRCNDNYHNGSKKNLRIDIFAEYPAAFILLDNEFHMKRGKIKMDDDNYDAFKEELQKLKPKSKVLKQVGAKVKTGKGKPPKVKLKNYMGSLDKMKPEDTDDWLKKHKGPYVVSNKEDGAGIQINYNPGKPTGLYTRGDGMVGQDISHLIPHVNIPATLKEPLDIRGELMMSETEFNRKWSTVAIGKKDGYENARNLASGIVNSAGVHQAIGDVRLIVHSIMSPRGKPSANLAKLKKLGFDVVPYKVYKNLTQKELSKILKIRKKKSDRLMDGLVVEKDEAVALRDGVNPEHARAYKEANEEDIVIVTVKAIVWEESRHGKLIPRIEIDPLRLQGVTVTYATGHNAYFIEHGFRYKDRKKGLPVRPLGPGAKIKITRSGDVIPHVISVEKAAKAPSMPTEYDYSYDKTRVNIIINKKSELSKVKRITHFFAKLKIEGIKQGVVQKMYDDGLTSILKIVKAKKARFLEIDGIQEKSAAKYWANIQGTLEHVPLPALMEASGAFGSGMGERRFKPLIKKYPDLLTKDRTDAQLRAAVMGVEGFSDTLSDQFVKNFAKFKEFYKKLGVKAEVPKAVKPTGSAFAGQVVAFTGVRDAEANDAIEKQGGRIATGVSSKTTMLVTKEMNSTSDKARKARAMGIEVISHAELRKKLKL